MMMSIWMETMMMTDTTAMMIMLPVQLPFTYAHELSHLLGVSNEAEANYWAYRVCRSSKRPAVRYSAYFGLLPYVLVNASSVLTEEEFREWIKTIRPEVVKDYEESLGVF